MSRRSCDGQKSCRWSTNTLFDICIKDTRVTSQRTEVLIHYIGWPNSYDEWRESCDIIERQSIASDAVTLFQTTLRTSIQEKLSLARKCDSKVILRIPIQKQTFTAIIHVHDLGVKVNRCSRSTKLIKYQPKHLENFLGIGWWYRINNKNGDFAYVKKATTTFWMQERRPLKTFSTDLEPTYVPRGFIFMLQFVKGKGNKTDMETGSSVKKS